ncbi:MAG TPA: beta-propeller fold lactonase family protein [Chthoniobacterales bacterium]|nr:beta-propeller fold lactonase family protein [Chthoniobacterales bacterium]
MKNLQSKLLVALVWIALSGSSRAEFLYVSYQSSITSFFLNENTGSLALLPSSPLAIPEGVGPLVLDRTGLYLYASTKGSFITDSWANIAGYRVSNDGSLTPLPGSPFNLTGGHLALDPFGRFLYAAADAQNGTVSVYRIRAHGALQPVPGSPFSSGSFSISITTDPFGRFVYVANFGSQDISSYRVLENGALSPVPGSPFPILGAGEPITVVVEHTGRFLYAANLAQLTSPLTASAPTAP